MGLDGISKDLLGKPQFIVDTSALFSGDKIEIEGLEARHITGSRRLRVGDNLRLCDGKGHVVFGKIVDLRGKRVKINPVFGPIYLDDRKDISFILSIIKSERFDLAISRLSEIGIRAIYPAITDRTLLRDFDEKRIRSKHLRWRRLSLEALKQSRGFYATNIHEPLPLKDLLKSLPDFSSMLVLHEKERGTGILNLLKRVKTPPFLIAIGPEGGFSERDMGLLKGKGFLKVGLSTRILRSETAAIYVASFLSEFLDGDENGYGVGDGKEQ